MDLADILKPPALRVTASLKGKKRLFQDCAELAAAAYGLEQGQVVDALQERESLGPTGVGHGVALPHARLDGIDHICGTFIRLERPLDYGSVDRAPVDLVFALFAPLEDGVEHLKALALVSRTLRDSTIRSKLRANDDIEKLYAILTARPDSKAA